MADILLILWAALIIYLFYLDSHPKIAYTKILPKMAKIIGVSNAAK